jgi:hypothetical protein
VAGRRAFIAELLPGVDVDLELADQHLADLGYRLPLRPKQTLLR